jgi:ribonuclease HI/ribosomal protein S27E
MFREDLRRGTDDFHIYQPIAVTPSIVRLALVAFGVKYLIIGCYLPTRDLIGSQAVLERITDVLPLNQPTIIMGDFNAHVRLTDGNPFVQPTNAAGLNFLEWTTANALTLCSRLTNKRKSQKRWTWHSAHGERRSTIDHVLTNRAARCLQPRSYVIRPTVKSDHKLLVTHLFPPSASVPRAKLPGLSQAEALPPRGDSELDRQWTPMEARMQQLTFDPEATRLPDYTSARTRELVDRRDKERRDPRHQLNVQIWRSLNQDRLEWMAALAENAHAQLNKNDIHGAFTTAQILYRKRTPLNHAEDATFDRATKFFSDLLTPPADAIFAPPQLPPLPPVAQPAQPTADALVAYTDGSYQHGIAGCGAVSEDPRMSQTYLATTNAPGAAIDIQRVYALTAQRNAIRDELANVRSVLCDGFAPGSSSYRAEVAAILLAAIGTPTGASLRVITDSQAAHAVLQRLHTVATTHYMEDLDLWRQIYLESFRIHMSSAWTKGHAGVHGNEMADVAAETGRSNASRVINRQRHYNSHLMAFISTRAQQVPPRPPVLDHPPTDDELRRAIGKLRRYKHPGAGAVLPDVFRTARDSEDPTFFNELAAFYRTCFETGQVPLRFLEGIMALLPKSSTHTDDPALMRGITVIPTFSKVLMNVLNERLLSVPLHPAQHGFVRQMSTLHAAIELKMRIRAARLNTRRFIAIYLDVAKAYDSVDRRAILYALAVRGAGPNTLRLFSFMLDNERTTIKLASRYSRAFNPQRGTRQGDPVSPALFDFVMDLVVREFIALRPNSAIPILYADDTCITGEDPVSLQDDLNALCACFARYGMTLNVGKTKYQVFLPPRNRTSERNYAPGTTYADHKRRNVTCNICGAIVTMSALKRHQVTRKCTSRAGTAAVPAAARDEREADLTDEDDESILAFHRRTEASLRFQVQNAYFFDMPVNKGNPPTICCLCRGDNPQTFTDRTALKKHLELVHDATAVFQPLGAHAGGRYINCADCGTAMLEPFLQKHQGSDLCRAKKAKYDERKRIERAFAPVPDFLLQDSAIERVQAFKYLGVWITSTDLDNLSISNNKTRACASYGALRHFVRCKKLTLSQRRTFVDVICGTSLLYGCETWALTQRLVSALRTCQQAFYRPISGLEWTIDNGKPRAPSSASVLKALEARDIENVVRRRRLRLAMKILADSVCLAGDTTRAALHDARSVGKGHALHPDWLRQVSLDATLCGVTLGAIPSNAAFAKIDNFDFVGKPLQMMH